MALDYTSLINTGVPLLTSLLGNRQIPGLPITTNQAGGAAALIAGSLAKQPSVTIPDYASFASPYGISASNYLQGAFTNPADPFAAGGTYEKYLPLLKQQQTKILNDAQQRIIAGLPTSLSTAMGGREIGSIGEALQNRIAPSYQALFADLQRENLSRQLQAATTLGGYEKFGQQSGFEAALEGAKQTAEAERNRNAQLVQLGLSLIQGGNPQAGQALLAQAQAGQGGTAGQQGGIGQALQQSLGGGGVTPGQPFAPIGQMNAADIIGQMQAGTLSASEGMALLSKFAPQLIGGGALVANASNIGQNQFQSAATGAAGGAIAGSAFGPVGTAIGAVAGGLYGLFGEHKDQQAMKAAMHQSDLDSQADAVQEIGTFFQQRLSGLGVDTSAFSNLMSTYVNDIHAGPSGHGGQYELAVAGGKLLLQAIQQRNPSITALSQVPGLRQEFIDYLTRSTFTAGNSIYGGGPPTQTFPDWANLAGLAQGGTLPAGGEFVVGERGPELLRAAPGSQVFPMLKRSSGEWTVDQSATNRTVVPPNFYLPQVSFPFEGPAPAPLFAIPTPQRSRGGRGQSTLTTALQQQRTGRKLHAATYP